MLHSDREGTERAGGISRRLHGIDHLNDRKKRAELCLFRDRKGRPIRIKDDRLASGKASKTRLSEKIDTKNARKRATRKGNRPPETVSSYGL